MARRNGKSAVADGDAANGNTDGVSSTADAAIGGTGGDTGTPELIYGYDAVEPATIDAGTVEPSGSGNSDGGNTGRRRGRPPGSGRKAGAVSRHLDVAEGIAGALYSIHLMLAAFTGVEELMLD